ncbi:PROTEIN PHOSPHATASE PP2-A REGULATORY SUBUNIT A [Encephalitozoon cuniculi GB-M1]|uniref:PROTEIN PHOSPHATASE PP2-A REGULATORY SUBUNIT A n=2 Tax=Encephalitozoon cuniculi TaxID=6035 RepID=Q8SQL2_ENCCU|nr:uncharacterized protein ECU09_1490 [Encephalitozoon cuniculi GB-M1]AGE96503.1 protein phosphatase pp2-a regulatory subunit a [Encephalitozoon cuniculi]KMV65417.1 hypothetical protein M970_091500 [Encephalitozoon cuniculi EcunIII-L]UYI26838.1 hypothetical protein J0A71_03g06760 [Encephalitozoon cuniculi]CAD27121.1 PROTEIN PHOSPHATASE PP2-A REGULATORY SUBUNIT A [Encephalitozoon cuniculi GB-M1]
MISNEVSSLAEKLGAREHLAVEKLELLVGMDQKLNDLLVAHLAALPPDRGHLGICGLMLIEEPEKIVPVARRILGSFPDEVDGFVKKLLESPFYIQRRAVPSLIVNIEYKETKEALRRCLQDPVVAVARCAALSLEEYGRIPFEDDELVQIVEDLHASYSECIQCTGSDVIPLIKRQTHFVSEICMSESWRRRYAIAKKIQKLNCSDRAAVYAHLSQDPEEEIRICLASNMEHVGDWDRLVPLFLKDSSPTVRAITIQTVGNREEFQEILRGVVSDGSWEVKKALLCVQRVDTYKNVVIPLINSLNSALNWRIRKEILESIACVSKQDERLLREFLGKYLLGYLHDRVYEVRAGASRVVAELVPRYSWTIEWLPEIEAAVLSRNYLHRITSVDAALSFDKAHGTEFAKRLLSDPIDNVKLYALEMVGLHGADESTRDMALDLCSSRDGEVRKAAESLLR